MLSTTKNIIVSAKRFAREAHKTIFVTTVSGDVRPQTEHLQEVADLVWASGGSDIEIAAAWLHDSVEDTSTTLIDIENKFGKEVAEIVCGLTDSKELKGLPSTEKKLKQAERVKNESLSVKRIKIADQISNVRMFTSDSKKEKSFEENKNYVMGAKLVVDECRGISFILDQLFDNEYKKTVEFFKL